MSELKNVVIVSGVRLPVGSFGGSLKDISAIDMGAMVVKEAVNRAGILPSDVDEVIIGQVGEIAENGFVARAISLKAGMPKETTAYSVNRQCGSGLQAIADCNGDSDMLCGCCVGWWRREYFAASLLCKRCQMGSQDGS